MGSHRIQELVTQLEDSDGVTRKRARETLTTIGDDAVPHLVGLLASPEDRLRWEAAKALDKIPDPAAITGLVSLLADPASEIKVAGRDGAHTPGKSVRTTRVRALADHAEDKGLRAASHHVLHDLAERNGVLRKIVDPLLAVLGETDPAATISTRAEVALLELGRSAETKLGTR